MKCMQTVGFLIPRPCRTEAMGECPACRKPICPEHTVALSPTERACPDCAAKRSVGPQAERIAMFDYYAYDDSVFYWHGGGYTSTDYDAFDRDAGPAGEAAESLVES